MKTTIRTGTLVAALLLTTSLTPAFGAEVFNRIATFHVVDNLPADADPTEGTVSEIIAATEDGMTLVYTDSPGKRVGMVDLADARAPKAGGVVGLEGEPTSVVIVGGKALVGVVTSNRRTTRPATSRSSTSRRRRSIRPAISAASRTRSPSALTRPFSPSRSKTSATRK